ncbi:MAG TPA: hypothetical protein VNB91_09185 [Jatrophihabitantaceae bacterium]|nr:hypothetical protein [Jatrophihabitantaceae bacterium]
MDGHCAVPQSALYEHGLLVGVVLGPEPASLAWCHASAQGGHSDELLWAGDLADDDAERPEAPDRHPSVRGRGPATHLAAAATADALTAGMLPHRRARVGPSQRIAATLGYRVLGEQVSLRLAT